MFLVSEEQATLTVKRTMGETAKGGPEYNNIITMMEWDGEEKERNTKKA